MKVALYARVSTSDKDPNPETQLLPLRDFCSAQAGKSLVNMLIMLPPMTWPTASSGANSWMMQRSGASRWC